MVVERERPIHKLVEQFLKLNPPRFTGAGDPEITSLWIHDLEKAFALLMCNEEEKVVLAVYQLQGNANTWWRATKGTIFPEGVVPVWNSFLRAFNSKYFSSSAREQKMEELQRLCQGMLTIDQYEAKFAELFQYAPRLIDDPEDKARWFKNGLRPELRNPLVPFDLKDYNEVYGQAQLIERNLSEQTTASGSRFSSNRDRNRFRKRTMTGGRYHVLPSRNGGVSKLAPSQNGVCRFCGRRHGSAPCHLRMGACFECGQQGHLARDCPKRPRGLQQLLPPPPMGQNRMIVPQIAQ
ncbi:hypothetical protein ACJRO7_027472 [Eucalyptus globulus]|uniref:CCHC-type domain-containing protein n=1 Tax=Eucalyptus globulus TaxID=34317 RepID=A0ABD3JRD2_EUCGL